MYTERVLPRAWPMSQSKFRRCIRFKLLTYGLINQTPSACCCWLLLLTENCLFLQNAAPDPLHTDGFHPAKSLIAESLFPRPGG